MSNPIRIQKYCADCGVCSRRAAEAEIACGAILVNGIPATIGQKIDPEIDRVTYRGKPVLPPDENRRYILLNKPRGIVCTAKDEKGRTPVTDLVSIPGVRLYPVGRLDMDSDGMILLTNDGEFANRMTHPRHEIPKLYRVTFRAPVSDEHLRALSGPMELDGYRLLPVGVRRIREDQLELTLREGRNRQIRRMCESIGLEIVRLSRTAIGRIGLGSLSPGAWRDLTEEEVLYLKGKKNEPKTEDSHAGSIAHSGKK